MIPPPGTRRCGQSHVAARRAGWLVPVLVCCAALALFAADGEPPGDGAGDSRLQLKQLRHEREQLRLNLEAYAGSERKSVGELEELTEQVRAAKRRERQLKRRRGQLLEERTRRGRRIRTLRKRIAASEGRIGEHLRSVYRLSKVADSASLLTLSSYKSYFKDSSYLALLTRLDREALTRFQGLKEDLQTAQDAAQHTLNELADVMDALVAEQVQLVESERVLQRSLKEIRDNQALSREYLRELEETMTGMEQALAQLEAQPAAPTLERLPDPETLKGHLRPPAEGTVIAAFGEQDPRYALKKFQRGIVILAAEGGPVRAVTTGRVVHAGPFRGYQELVVLEHAQGLFTVYGHLERLKIQKGSWVEQGSPLGQTAYQPAEGGYNVYFEVRLQGTPEDPLLWLEPNSLAFADSAAKN